MAVKMLAVLEQTKPTSSVLTTLTGTPSIHLLLVFARQHEGHPG